MPPTQPIDLSAGLEPIQAPAAATQPQSGAIDLSAGLEPIAASTPTPDSSAPGFGENVWGGIKRGASSVLDAVKGIAPPTNTEAATTLPGKTLGMAEDVAQGINNLTGITTVTDSLRTAGHVIDAYEKSRASGGSIMDALHAANVRASQADEITPFVLSRVEDFKKNPTAATSQALTEAAALAATVWAGGKALKLAVPTVRGIIPGAAEADALRPPNPFRKPIPVSGVAADTAATASKIEPAVAARTAKAGLAPGEAGLTPGDAAQKTAQAAADAKAATQMNLDQTLQNISAQHAADNKLPAPAAGTVSRDVLTANGDALVDAGKANYKILDKYTDGKFTNAQQELKNAQLELRAQAGTTSADTAALEANVTRAQWNVDQLFDTAVKNGMPKDTADLARTQFRAGQATLDAGNAVRMANRARGVSGLRTTDLNVLENRWTALHDSGRLQQAFGEQGAKDALTQIHAAREAGEVFESMPSTESKALQDLIRKNTTTGKFMTTTDWVNVRDQFSQMTDLGTRFSDIPKVEKFLNDQAFYQSFRKWGLRTAGAGALGAAGAAGVGIYRAATD